MPTGDTISHSATSNVELPLASTEWRNGWKLVLASAMGMGLTAGPIYSLGVFFPPLEAQFGWSRSNMAVAVSITSVITGLAAPFVGRLIDRYGARKIALLGTVITCAGVGALSAINSTILSYWAAWLVISIGFVFGAPLSWTLAVATRFNRSRGLALSVTLCGTNLVGAVAPPLATVLIQLFGWRVTYLALALSLLATVLPLALAYFYDAGDLSKRRPSSVASPSTIAGEGSTLSEALGTRAFWMMAISFVFGGGGLVGLIIHFIPLLIDSGLSPLIAASAASVLSIGAVVGRLAGGVAMDRVFAPRIAAVAFTCPILACIALTLAPGSLTWALLAGALIGMALGAEYNLMSYLSARYFGFKQYGVIYGVIFGAFTLGQAISPPIIGYLYGATGSYHKALVLVSGCFLISAVLLQFCGRYPQWKTRPAGI